MVPPLESWPVSQLPERLQVYQSGFKDKKRKGEPIDLKKCELLEMVQYSCWPDERALEVVQGQLRVNLREFGEVTCDPLVRLFRKCAEGVTVETTAWEKAQSGPRAKSDLQPLKSGDPESTDKASWASRWWANK